jgi:hypothetical protein
MNKQTSTRAISSDMGLLLLAGVKGRSCCLLMIWKREKVASRLRREGEIGVIDAAKLPGRSLLRRNVGIKRGCHSWRQWMNRTSVAGHACCSSPRAPDA